MSSRAIRSLFHSLVVVGASVSACGGRSEYSPAGRASGGAGGSVDARGGTGASSDVPASGGGGTGGVPGGAATGGAGPGAADGYRFCDAPAQWQCDDYAKHTGCHCDPSLPTSATDCASPFDFTCSEYLGTVNGELAFGCSCQPGSLTPADCAASQQFTCSHYDPFTGCHCDESAPLSQADCPACGWFSCWSDYAGAPDGGLEYGCRCVACIR